MRIILKKIEDVNLSVPKFVCDEPISKKELPMPFELMNRSNCTLFLGPPSSGKTSLMVSIISQNNPRLFKKQYDKIILVCPPNSIGSLKKNIFQNLKGGVYSDLTSESIDQIYDKVQANADEKENTLLILDDMSASLKKNKYIQDRLSKMLYNRRHLRLSVYICLQSFKTLPLNIRKCTDNAFVFKVAKKEIECLYDELFDIDKDVVRQIVGMVYTEKHNWLFLNVPSQQMFTNEFKELILDDES